MKLSIRLCYFTALLVLMFSSSVIAQQPPQKAPAPQQAAAEPMLGREYTRVSPSQPTDSGAKIEVLEFFWYGCIHCYNLEAPLKAWLKRKPADVDYRYVPAIYDLASWGPLARAYYALDAMGIVEKHHDEIFNAIHRDGQKAIVNDPRALADWLARRGVDRQKFLDTLSSFAVSGRTQRSVDMTRRYDVPGTPALVIDGKYMTSPSNTLAPNNNVDYVRFFQVMDQLIARARKERASQK